MVRGISRQTLRSAQLNYVKKQARSSKYSANKATKPSTKKATVIPKTKQETNTAAITPANTPDKTQPASFENLSKEFTSAIASLSNGLSTITSSYGDEQKNSVAESLDTIRAALASIAATIAQASSPSQDNPSSSAQTSHIPLVPGSGSAESPAEPAQGEDGLPGEPILAAPALSEDGHANAASPEEVVSDADLTVPSAHGNFFLLSQSATASGTDASLVPGIASDDQTIAQVAPEDETELFAGQGAGRADAIAAPAGAIIDRYREHDDAGAALGARLSIAV